MQPVVGIEEIEGGGPRHGGEREVDAGIARRRNSPIGLPQHEDPAGMGGGEIQRGARGGRIGAAVIDHHHGGRRRAGLVQRGQDRLRQQSRLAEGGDDDGDGDILRHQHAETAPERSRAK